MLDNNFEFDGKEIKLNKDNIKEVKEETSEEDKKTTPVNVYHDGEHVGKSNPITVEPKGKLTFTMEEMEELEAYPPNNHPVRHFKDGEEKGPTEFTDEEDFEFSPRYEDDTYEEDISEEKLQKLEEKAKEHLEETTDEETKEELQNNLEESQEMSAYIDYLKNQNVEEDLTNPNHYKVLDMESIDLMELKYGTKAVMAFSLLNSEKYMYRAPHKGNYTLDTEKANWYIKKYRELSKKIKRGDGIAGLSKLLVD